MKRTIALFLCLIMCLSLFPVGAFAEEDIGGEVVDITQNSVPEVYEEPDNKPAEMLEEYTELVKEPENGKKTVIIAPKNELGVGEAIQLSVETLTPVIWSSSDDAVLTVDNLGLAMAVGEGTATVYADVNGERLSVELKVSAAALLVEAADSDEPPIEWLSVGDNFVHRYYNHVFKAPQTGYYTFSPETGSYLVFYTPYDYGDGYYYHIVQNSFSVFLTAGEEFDDVHIIDSSNSMFLSQIDGVIRICYGDDFIHAEPVADTIHNKAAEFKLNFHSNIDASNLSYGIRYSTDPNFANAFTTEKDVIPSTDFTGYILSGGNINISGLSPTTGYYYQAYLRDRGSDSYIYGDVGYFETTSYNTEPLVLNIPCAFTAEPGEQYGFYFTVPDNSIYTITLNCPGTVAVTGLNTLYTVLKDDSEGKYRYTFNNSDGAEIFIKVSPQITAPTTTEIAVAPAETACSQLELGKSMELGGEWTSKTFFVRFDEPAAPSTEDLQYFITLNSPGSFMNSSSVRTLSTGIAPGIYYSGAMTILRAYSYSYGSACVEIQRPSDQTVSVMFDSSENLQEVYPGENDTSESKLPFFLFTPETDGEYRFTGKKDNSTVYISNVLSAGQRWIVELFYGEAKPITSVTVEKIQSSYTVAYDANGGEGAPGSQSKTVGADLTLDYSIPTREGYTFLGWAVSKDTAEVKYQPGGRYTINADVTLYAVWKLNVYTVSYNANGGENPPAAQKKNHGEDIILTDDTPTRDGFTFLGWADTPDASAVQYWPGGRYTINADVTLYAVWKLNIYTVSYNANGGKNPPAAQNKNPGEDIILADGKPTRKGYTFLGWADTPGASVVQYWPGGSYTNDENITLYAVWSKNLTGTCGENLIWTLYYDGALEISGTGAMYDYESTDAPWYSQRSSIKTVRIGNNVMRIGDFAFYNCFALTSVTFGNSVTNIGDRAFYGCAGLTSVTIGNSVTSIGNYAFYGCAGLTSVTIGNSVANIGDRAFFGCFGLTNVTIPDSVTNIGGYAFESCRNLTSMTIGSGVTSIGEAAFYYCTSLTSVTIPNSVTHISHYAFGNCFGLTSVTIPNSVTSIGNYAFYDCSGLTSVTIPNSVRSIGDYAFYGCSGLTSVTIGSSVTSIGEAAFYYCPGLTSVTIPNSVRSIGVNAFRYCSNLTSVTIGNSVTSIGSYAFYYCDSLTSVTIPNSVTSIGDYAFYDCSGLTSVTIPNSVRSIGDSAFYGCSGLTSVTIGSSVTSIGYAAFYGCDSLTGVYISDLSAWCNIVFKYEDSNPLYIAHRLYLNGSLVTELIIPNSVTSIGSYAFYYCDSLTSVTIPNSVTSIGDSTFEGCTNPTNMTIPNSVTSIGDRAFCGCTRLTSVMIPDSVTSIGSVAFARCSSLTSVTIPDSVTSIGGRAFGSCSGLTSITIPNSMTNIGDYTFEYCSNLRSVTIPDSVTSIGVAAFKNCTALKDVYYTGTEAQWGKISIYTYNTYLICARVYYNCVSSSGNGSSSGDSAWNKDIKTLHINVLENEKPQHEGERYINSENAEIFVNNKSVGKTDAAGEYTIDTPKTAVTVKKDGYVEVTLTVEQLKENNVIYLEKETDHPVFKAVWAKKNGSSKVFNILRKDIAVDFTEKIEYAITPDVYWGKDRSAGVLRLYQDGRTVELANGANSVVLTDHFNIDKPIYAIAVNDLGNSVRLELRIENSAKKYLDGFSFNIFDGLKIKLSDSITDSFPFLPSEMKLGFLESKLPVRCAVEDGKVLFAIGCRTNAKPGDEDAQLEEVRSFVNTAKNLRNSLKNAKDSIESYRRIQDAMKAFGGKLAICKGSFGVDGNYTAMLFIEGYIRDGHFVKTDGGGIVGFDASAEYSQPFMAGPVPMFFEVKFKGELESQVNMYINEEIRSFTPDMELTLDLTLSGGVGVGLADVASLSGGLTGKLSNTMNVNALIDYYRLKAALDWYIKLEVLFMEFKWGDTITEATLCEYPDPLKAAGVEEANGFDRRLLYNAALYTPEPLPYRSAEPELSASGASPHFVENAYDNAAPQVAVFEDGTRLAVWVDVNTNTPGYDGLNLYYSYYDGEWSAPKLVDGGSVTMDAAPSLEVINGKAYLVWQDATASVNGAENLAQLSGVMGISAAVYDPLEDSFVVSHLTSGGVLDMSPQICGDGSTVYAVWLRNEANDWFGQNSANSILFSSFTGSGWTAPSVVAAGLNPVLGFSACCAGGGLNVAYALDMDGDLGTTSDVEIFANGAQLTNNDVLDSGVCYAPDGTLFWYSEGKLIANGTPVASGLNTDRIQVVSKNGVNAVLFPQEDGLATVICAMYYSGGWGSPVPIYSVGTSVSQFDADVTPDGRLTMLIKNQAVIGDYTSDAPYGACSLDWFNPPVGGCDLRLDDVSFDASEYLAENTMNFTLSVSNTGSVMAENVNVKVTDEDGKVYYDKLHIENILSGQTAELVASVEMEDVVQGRKLTFEIAPESVTDTNTEDNRMTVELSWNDVSVENLRTVELEDSTVIYASIVNRGHDVQENITVKLCEGTPDGTVIETKTVESIEPFDQQTVSFTLENPKAGTYYVCIEHPEKDDSYGDDEDFIVIAASTAQPAATLTLPAALTKIEAEAFMGVTAEVIVVPAGVTEIGSKAFADCPKLSKIIFLGNFDSIDIAPDWLDYREDVEIVTP